MQLTKSKLVSVATTSFIHLPEYQSAYNSQVVGEMHNTTQSF